MTHADDTHLWHVDGAQSWRTLNAHIDDTRWWHIYDTRRWRTLNAHIDDTHWWHTFITHVDGAQSWRTSNVHIVGTHLWLTLVTHIEGAHWMHTLTTHADGTYSWYTFMNKGTVTGQTFQDVTMATVKTNSSNLHCPSAFSWQRTKSSKCLCTRNWIGRLVYPTGCPV